MYRVACGLRDRGGWAISPSEFWFMSPSDWWLLYDFNIGNEISEREQTAERLQRLYRQSVKG